jgi:hypothetical protein
MKTSERGVMPHYKCDACRARLRVSGTSEGSVADFCPECGSLLAPVTELTQLVGLRSIASRDASAATDGSEPRERIADLLDTFAARRSRMLERQRLDAERWLDDSHEPQAAAVVLPPPPSDV